MSETAETSLAEFGRETAREAGFLLALAEVLPGVIYQAHIFPDGRAVVQFMSEAARTMLECDPRELVGEAGRFRSMIHPDDRERFKASVDARRFSAGTWQLDYRLMLRSGRVIWISSQASVASAPEGGTIWRGFFTDITARKQSEQDLAAERERLALATEAGHLGTWDVDLASGTARWNRFMYDLHGVSPQTHQPTADNGFDFAPPDDRAALRERQAGFLASDAKRFSQEANVVLPGGGRRLIRYQGVIIRDAQGKPVRLVGIALDVTADREAHALLVSAKEAAEAVAQAKSDFLATMSHELRTPMNGILGYAELLRSSTLDADQAQLLQVIEHSGQRLLNVVNDILDLSQIEHGRLPIVPSPFDPRACVAQVFAMLAPLAREKHLLFEWSADPGLPAGMISDEGRVAQVLTNLLGNAIKFTAAGSVRLSLRAERESGDHHLWEFRVADTGKGMSPETLAHIFEPFYQGQVAPSPRRARGTGLGLAISRRLASLLDGSIEAWSEPGRGSEFRFTLRAPALAALAAAPSFQARSA